MLRAIAATGILLTGILVASAPAYAASLEPLSYKEALSRFNATGHDSPGVWLCGYSITDQHFTMREGMSTSLVEVDERFLYLRNNGEIVELETSDTGKRRLVYRSRNGDVRLTMKVLKQFNTSEYGESHDRQAEATLHTPHATTRLFLLGRSCGV
ncbi:hypothetical protein LRS11_05455 [Pseudomonas sp. J452]|uniref:hypothetical protein n=1 Tax=Pseudomonas sp. J452 TaxID=2898441 RepID=UPI0021AD7B61|nr:hypothetical protein [Pseudomonas sp. J452]UUY09485.1 hypothetical protein LRS11_05455 [Pseudomonas sp. J452]